MSLIVMKFGGSSLANFKKLDNVTKKIIDKLKPKKKIIVVVSAMGNTTDNLIKEYSKVSKCHFNSDFDNIISTGEQISAGFLSSMLNKQGINSLSLLGWQVPIKTDDFHGKARIVEIPKRNILNLFKKFDVLVITGFQGLSNDNRVTTLGRGGSDTSAVAIAAATKADVCEIYTDVEGILTADPREVSKAKKISEITYEEILEMASLGSKVLQPRSVELAMKYDIKVHVRSSFSNKKGTLVVKEGNKLEKEVVTGISSSDDESKITLMGIPDTPGVASKIFSPLADANVNVDMIVQNITDDGKMTSLTFTVINNESKKAINAIKKSEVKVKKIHEDKKICKISIIGVGMKSHVGVAKKMFDTLASENINIQVISTSEIKISVLISKEKKRVAVKALHKAYKLSN